MLFSLSCIAYKMGHSKNSLGRYHKKGAAKKAYISYISVYLENLSFHYIK